MSGYPMIDALNAAPTPRETADFEALAVEASAARNLDGAESMMVSIQTIYDLISSRNALLSEIAALRGALAEAERDVSSWSRCAGEVVTIGESWKERFVQAERQRDELRKALERAADDLRDIGNQSPRPSNSPDPEHENYLRRVLISLGQVGNTRARQALANQGADQ